MNVRQHRSEVSTQYAVLDLKFAPENQGFFAVATSTGAIEFYDLDLTDGGSINKRRSFQICEPSILVLSLAWKPICDSRIAMSLSDGKVGELWYSASTHSLRLVQAHSLEAWTAQWSCPTTTDSTATLYSGGDDSIICRHETQIGDEQVTVDGAEAEDEVYKPFCQDKRIHGAGVTAILPSPIRDDAAEIILTGSYDEQIRIVAVDLVARSWKVLAEKRLHGGVWKLKELSQISSSTHEFGILASCMHGGAMLLKIQRSNENRWSITIIAKFSEHESMVYASDARPSLSSEGVNRSMTVVSTSFYDRKLCVWSIDQVPRTD